MLVHCTILLYFSSQRYVKTYSVLEYVYIMCGTDNCYLYHCKLVRQYGSRRSSFSDPSRLIDPVNWIGNLIPWSGVPLGSLGHVLYCHIQISSRAGTPSNTVMLQPHPLYTCWRFRESRPSSVMKRCWPWPYSNSILRKLGASGVFLFQVLRNKPW